MAGLTPYERRLFIQHWKARPSQSLMEDAAWATWALHIQVSPAFVSDLYNEVLETGELVLGEDEPI